MKTYGVKVMSYWKRRRLANYNYSDNGLYFVTICCQQKENYFWDKDRYENGVIEFTRAGEITKEVIENISENYKNTRIDNYVVMPNHVHFIIELSNADVNLSIIVNQLKGVISKRLGYSPWQRSFHDHIIRGEKDYEMIWNYIEANPSKWNEDKYYL